MDQFKTLYYDYCKTYNVEPNEIILGEIQKISNEDNQTKIFNLSSLNIPEEQYTVLGKLFSHDSLYTSIHLNDCNLSSQVLTYELL
ncbi:unnamed protein product [Rotaria sordida]|uniref:Uncharacterized protein n=1 Tax=Rotaria sordida TaxID=392033 RepID=A0A819ZZ21_9BILA|nr:unnamed protein product [Rotaria sordida]